MLNLSIILPVYNVDRYLKRCLYSIKPLLEEDVELIIVNDGSTDESPRIIDEFVETYNRFKIKVINQNNKGLSGARNSGLTIAKGKYIWFIDSDDTIFPEKALTLINQLTKNNVDLIVFGRMEIFKNCQNTFIPYFPQDNPIIGKRYLELALMHSKFRTNVWDKIYNRSYLIENNLSFIEGLLYEDMLFNYQAFNLAKKVLVYPHELYGYICTNISSITNNIRKKDLDVLVFAEYARQTYELNKGSHEEYIFNNLMFTWISSCLINKYVRIQKNNTSSQILTATLSNEIFISSAKYCFLHKSIPLRVRIFSGLLLFNKNLYCKITKFALKIQTKLRG